MILIAGIGYIGESLADHLHASGESVAGLTRSSDSAAALDRAKPFPVHACDISNREALLERVSDFDDVHAVVHCASSGHGGAESYRSVYLEGARNLLDLFPDTRLLFTSSTGVYAQDDDSTVSEDSPAEPDRETGRILVEAENLVLGSGGIIARIAGIYGPGRSVHLRRFLAGEAVIEDGGGRYLNQAHRADIVSAIALLLGSAEASGQVYNIVDDTPQTQRACYSFLAEHFEKDLPPSRARESESKRGWSSKRVSNARLRGLGWAPEFPSFKDAVLNDPALVPSIEAQIQP
jgi:nucleoside-diphosphate-sugar epimerase